MIHATTIWNSSSAPQADIFELYDAKILSKTDFVRRKQKFYSAAGENFELYDAKTL